jgi:hypothetical protein
MKHLFIVLAATMQLRRPAQCTHSSKRTDAAGLRDPRQAHLTPPATAEPINRSGRDSLYVTQLRRPLSPPAPSVATGPVRHGRDSVYARGSPNAPAATPTQVGSAASGQGR